jgi:hypothetical protein
VNDLSIRRKANSSSTCYFSKARPTLGHSGRVRELDHRKNREYVRVVLTCDQVHSTWSWINSRPTMYGGEVDPRGRGDNGGSGYDGGIDGSST